MGCELRAGRCSVGSLAPSVKGLFPGQLGGQLGSGECGLQSGADTGDAGVDGVAAIANLVQHLGVAGGKGDLQPRAAWRVRQVQDGEMVVDSAEGPRHQGYAITRAKNPN